MNTQNNSMPGNQAVGICDRCGSPVVFPANETRANCPSCTCPQTRMTTAAVDGNAIRSGFRVGEGVRPSWGPR